MLVVISMPLMKYLNSLVVASCAVLGLASCVDEETPADESSVEQDIAAPTLSGTVVSSTQIKLTWNAISGATKYYVFEGNTPGSEAYLATAVGTSYTNGHLTPGTQYCWKIESVIVNTPSVPSNEVCLTTKGLPAPPSNVVATATSSSRVNVTWNAVTGAQKYYVYDSFNGGSFTFASTSVTTSATIANLQTGGQYCFEVEVVTSNGTSGPSVPACTSTFAAGLEGFYKFDEGSGSRAVDSSGFGRNGTLAGNVAYQVDHATIDNDKSSLLFNGGSGDFVTVPSNPVFNLTGDFTVALWVKPAATGTIRILGKRAAGCGASAWALVQDTTNGLHFDGATLQRKFGQSLPVGAWSHVAVTRSGGNGNASVLYINGTRVASGAFNVGTAAAATSAPLQLGNAGGCGSTAKASLDHVQIYTKALSASEISDLGKIPPAPANLVATVNASYSVSLNWSAVTGATKYLIYRGTATGNEVLVASIGATTSYTDNHLSPSTQYSWKVADVAHGLISPQSNERIVTTQAVPAAPTGVTATAAGSTRITVGWTAVSGAEKYYVYQSTSGGPYVLKGTAVAPNVTFSATGLTTHTTYSYEIQVVTANGTSASSTPASATTL